MRKLLYLVTLTMAATLLFAPVALGQGVSPSGGSGSYGCPEELPFVATPAGAPGEANLRCFATQEEANIYSETGGAAEPPVTEEPPVSETQYETPAAPQDPPVAEEETQPLPDTGGPSLVLIAAGLLLSTGIFGLFLQRLRVNG